MTLKLAAEEDLITVVPMIRNFYETTPYSKLAFDEDGVRKKLQEMVSHKSGPCTVILSVKDELPVGFLIGVAQPLLFSSDLVAVEAGWWVEPEYRNSRRAFELHNAFLYWAKLRGCKAASMSTIHGEFSEQLEKLYTRKGYEKTEVNFMRFL